MIDTFITAIQFLTILPVRTRKMTGKEQLGRAAGWFSYVGLLIGLITGGILYIARIVFPGMLAAALTVTVWIFLTGGLHLDGVADCCDALFVSAERERRLEIMRDPHHGTFGTIGLVLVILLKFAALFVLHTDQVLFILPFACALSRWLLLPAGKLPSSRPGGLGEHFSNGLQDQAFFWGLIPLIIMGSMIGWISILIVLLTFGFAFLLLWFARKQLGGITGDVMGFVVEFSETLVLIGLCANIILIQ